jgi:hypothetical protein
VSRVRIGFGRRRRLLTDCRRSVLVSAGPARGSQSALRIEQEDAGRHDLFTFSQAFADLDAIGQLGADRYGSRLEHVAHRHEHVLLQTCVDDGVAGHSDDVLSSRFEHGGPVEARPERAAWISCRETNSERAGPFGHRRVNEIDARRER